MTKVEQKLLKLGYENSKDNHWDYIKTPYNGVKIIISLPSSFCNSAICENAYIEVNKYIISYKDDIEDLINIYDEFEKDLKELESNEEN